jgi:hypothetical protein
MSATLNMPIQAVVLDTVAEAQQAVGRLRQAGFTTKEISVLCSDESKLKPFTQYVEEEPAGSHTSEALAAAGTVGLGLGTAAVATSIVTTGGAALFVIGAFTGVAMVGTFVSAMLTRGTEKTLADYYDQSITHGKLLVAIETSDPARQKLASRIFDELRAPPQPLEREV